LLYGPVAHDDAGILCPTGKSIAMEVLGSVNKGEVSSLDVPSLLCFYIENNTGIK